MLEPLEFELDDGGRLRLEMSQDGELTVVLQARHPGEGWKVTATTATIDSSRTATVRKWLISSGGDNGLA